ncbi:hypothetical protein [Alterisphingorhabdus coralli]|uniref:Uncharacterized protein n=1 Tax=Alterisphingorhabdus coralli TaxID=3071408 RepID=A0AA97I1H7_9SPHN|nr:hypothetical protein [Parasphingorhabdus sp. SCSIO 66989]WOE76052.1 hypothetical protein RB602_04850 [Parasphingorhabdus sp. SCSIO 66989]
MLAAATALDRSVARLRLALQAEDIGDVRDMHAEVRRQFTALREQPEWLSSDRYGVQLRLLVKSLSEADRVLAHANDINDSTTAHESVVHWPSPEPEPVNDDRSTASMLTTRTKALEDIRRKMQAFRVAHLDGDTETQ